MTATFTVWSGVNSVPLDNPQDIKGMLSNVPSPGCFQKKYSKVPLLCLPYLFGYKTGFSLQITKSVL